MHKTIRTLALLLLTAAVLLTGCTVRSRQTDVPAARTETTEETTQSLTQAVWSEPASAEACDIALPMELPETAQEELSSMEWTTQTTAAPTTAAAATAATTASTTVTTTVTTTAKPTTTAAAAPSTTVSETTTAVTSTSSTAAATTKAATTVPTTTAAVTRSAAKTQSAAPTNAKAVLNSAALHPQKTNDAELDAAVQQVFDRIFRPGMNTYDKVVACYDYIIDHAEYGRPKMVVTQDDLKAYQKEQDAWIVLFSKRILQNGQGVCDDYSALFLVMTRAIGLDCYYTHGYTTNTKGETKDHVWDTITVGGVDYIFDPQVEDKQSANGIKYTFFCQPYNASIAKIYSGYDLAADKAAYNAFRK